MKTREFLHEVMALAWQFVRANSFGMSDALKLAWVNLKLKNEMENRIVRFRFVRVDGIVREASGTLDERLLPAPKGTDTRAKSEAVQVYYDIERGGFRSFRKVNLLSIA